MGGIPVLNDNQMNALRRVVGTNQKFDLTVAPQGKSRRLPSYPEDTSPGYSGMFAVTENEDGTVVVEGGMAITGFGSGPRAVEGTTLRKTSRDGLQIVMLNARLDDGNWELFFSIQRGMTGGYIPGEQICWPLAQLASLGPPLRSFAQLWQGGVIDFSSRYYLA